MKILQNSFHLLNFQKVVGWQRVGQPIHPTSHLHQQRSRQLHLYHLLDSFQQDIEALILVVPCEDPGHAGEGTIDDLRPVPYFEGFHFSGRLQEISRVYKPMDELIFFFAQDGGLAVVADVPGNARSLQNAGDPVVEVPDKNVRIEQRHLYSFLAVTPLTHDLLHGKKYIIATFQEKVLHLFLLPAFCIEDVPLLAHFFTTKAPGFLATKTPGFLATKALRH